MGEQVGVVVMAYGTPRAEEEILPYYIDIRRGRPPTPELLADLTARYAAIGGLSPLGEITAAQRAAIAGELARIAPGRYVTALGLKHAEPTIEDAIDELAAAGIRTTIGVVLAPHYSAASIGQYLGRARDAAARHGMRVDAVESWAVEPAFVGFVATDLADRLATMPSRTRVLFTAHSLPERAVADGDPYPSEVAATARAVAATLGLVEGREWQLAWQSAGRTPEPWLGPDVLEVLDVLGDDPDVDGVVVAAVGFVADHLEVLYDLDIEAAGRAATNGLAFARTASVDADASVMAALAERVHHVAGANG